MRIVGCTSTWTHRRRTWSTHCLQTLGRRGVPATSKQAKAQRAVPIFIELSVVRRTSVLTNNKRESSLMKVSFVYGYGTNSHTECCKIQALPFLYFHKTGLIPTRCGANLDLGFLVGGHNTANWSTDVILRRMLSTICLPQLSSRRFRRWQDAKASKATETFSVPLPKPKADIFYIFGSKQVSGFFNTILTIKKLYQKMEVGLFLPQSCIDWLQRLKS